MVKHIYYPFTFKIPWEVNKNVLVPKISKTFWNKYVKNNPINIVCAGYMLEVIICASIYKLFINNNLKPNKWILPSYYNSALNLFEIKIDNRTDTSNVLMERDSINEIAKSYISPIFFDGDNNVYYNLLFNYGNIVSINNVYKCRNEMPFWKQIINNLCFGNVNFKINKFDYRKAKQICYSYLESIGIKYEEKFAIIDNSNIIAETADGREVEQILFFPIQIKQIVDNLKKRKIKALVMTNNADSYKCIGINNIIPSWNMIDSGQFISLLSCADTIISSDQNLYLLGAILGVENIISLDKKCKGWSFDDIEDVKLLDINSNWKYYDGNIETLGVI